MTAESQIMKTERLLFRKFVESDIDNVFKGLSHTDIIKYYGVSHQTSRLGS